MSKTTL